MSGRISPIKSSAYRPIILHHFTGRPGWRFFGHIALQVGNMYYTYGPDETKELAPAHDLQDAIVTDEIRYGGEHQEFKIPQEFCLSDEEMQARVEKFQQNWAPNAYALMRKNCAHCGTDGLLTFLKLPDEIGTKLKTLATAYGTRPASVAETVSKEILKTLIRSSSKEKKEGAIDEPAKILLERLIDQTIEILDREKHNKSKDFVKNNQAAILKLIQLLDKIPVLKIPELLVEIANLIKEVTPLNKFAGEKLRDCQEILQVIPKNKLVDEEKAYQEVHKQQLDQKNKLMVCYRQFDEINQLLKNEEVRENTFEFYKLISQKIKEIHAKNLQQVLAGKDPELEKFAAIQDLIHACFKEVDLAGINKLIRSQKILDTEKPIRENFDKFQQIKIQFIKIENPSVSQIQQFRAAVLDMAAIFKPKLPEAKKTVSQPEMKSIAEPVITAQHLAWVYLQIKKIHFWNSQKKSTQLHRSQNLLVQAYLHQRDQGELHPVEQFKNMLEKVRAEWRQSAESYNTLVKNKGADSLDTELSTSNTVAFLNKTLRKKPGENTLGRDLSNLVLQMETLLASSNKNHPNLVLPYAVNLENLNPKLKDENHAETLFVLMKTLHIQQLPDGLSTKPHLQLVAAQLQDMVTGNLLTYREALKELLEEVNRATAAAAIKDSPDHVYLAALKQMEVNKDTFIPEPTSQRSLSQPVVERKSEVPQGDMAKLLAIKAAFGELKALTKEFNEMDVEMKNINREPKVVLEAVIGIAEKALQKESVIAGLKIMLNTPPSTMQKMGGNLMLLVGIAELKNSAVETPNLNLKEFGAKNIAKWANKDIAVAPTKKLGGGS